MCPGRWASIIADARHYKADPMVAELLRIAEAKLRREEARHTWPEPARRVRCQGRVFSAERMQWERCPEMVTSARFGRTRRYHSARCARSAKWLRRKARRAEQGPSRLREAERARLASAELGWLEDGLATAEQPEPVPAPTARERRRWRDPRIRREPL
jgi:hypothetical protein